MAHGASNMTYKSVFEIIDGRRGDLKVWTVDLVALLERQTNLDNVKVS
jgi:hypothetical protein